MGLGAQGRAWPSATLLPVFAGSSSGGSRCKGAVQRVMAASGVLDATKPPRMRAATALTCSGGINPYFSDSKRYGASRVLWVFVGRKRVFLRISVAMAAIIVHAVVLVPTLPA